MTQATLPKILLIDDKPPNLLALSDILKDVEAELVTATSGNEALAFMTQHAFALVLLDVQIPGMDGLEVASLLRQSDTTKHTPIIFVTTFAKDETLMFKGYEAGAVDFIHKPIVPEILRSKTKVFLDLDKCKRQIELKVAELEGFASMAAHDLKAPLRVARQFCEFLKQDNVDTLDAKSLNDCDRIVTSMVRMTQLVDDLLDFAQAGQHDTTLQPVQLGDITDHVLSSLAGAIKDADARVAVGTLPTVLGDETGLTQLIQNLVDNAIKFRGEHSPVVGVSAERHADMWQVSVKDNGIGIKPSDHEKIFAAFKRLHNVSKFPGTGIGLATCAKVVERLGGRIWVESAPGEGTTFHFTLQTVECQAATGTEGR